MDEYLTFFTPMMVLFSVFVYFATTGFRYVVETITKHWYNKMPWWWDQLVLYMMPVAFGAVLAALLGEHYPFPSPIKTHAQRVMLGTVYGAASGFAFKIIRNSAAYFAKQQLLKLGASETQANAVIQAETEKTL